MFQVHLISTHSRSLERLKRVLEKLAEVNDPLQDIDRFETIITELKAAQSEFESELESSAEFPEVLPRQAREIVFASLIAEAFKLHFEITDYKPEPTATELVWWSVWGKVSDSRGVSRVFLGTSVPFDPNDEKLSTSALLFACADAFIQCIHSMAPYFPADLWSDTPPQIG
jgi:hypothetical protein